jgi:hypothetical protein
MAIAEHHPEKLRGLVPDMSHKQLHDFAATPEKGLPAHVKPKAKATGHPHANLGKYLHPKRGR